MIYQSPTLEWLQRIPWPHRLLRAIPIYKSKVGMVKVLHPQPEWPTVTTTPIKSRRPSPREKMNSRNLQRHRVLRQAFYLGWGPRWNLRVEITKPARKP